MPRKPEYVKADHNATWKANYQDLAARMEQAQMALAVREGIIYDALTSGVTLLGRCATGPYLGDVGFVWKDRAGRVVIVTDKQTWIYSSVQDALNLYNKLSDQPHNLEMRALLARHLEVSHAA